MTGKQGLLLCREKHPQSQRQEHSCGKRERRASFISGGSPVSSWAQPSCWAEVVFHVLAIHAELERAASWLTQVPRGFPIKSHLERAFRPCSCFQHFQQLIIVADSWYSQRNYQLQPSLLAKGSWGHVTRLSSYYNILIFSHTNLSFRWPGLLPETASSATHHSISPISVST